MAKLIEKFLLLDKNVLFATCFGICVIVLIRFTGIIVDLLQHAVSFLPEIGTIAEWVVALSVMGIAAAVVAAVIAVFFMSEALHERRSFQPVIY